MFLIPIEVECHAGHKADSHPRAIVWGGRRREVVEIVDRWYEGAVDPTRPIANYFKVRIEDDREILLKQVGEGGEWYLVESFRSDRD